MVNFHRVIRVVLVIIILALQAPGEATARFQHLIPLEEHLMDFAEGLAPVKSGWRFGYIDTNGRLAIELDYDGAKPFSEGLAVVRKGNLYGYIDKQARWVIAPQYADAGRFSEGLAPVRLQDKYGYIDTTGRMVIAPVFDVAAPFSEGLAAVSLGGRFGCISKAGAFVIKPQFLELGSFSEGLAVARTTPSAGYGYVGKDGAWVIPPRFRRAGEFSEGLATVQTEEKFSYINKQGQLVFAPQFQAAGPFRDKLAGVKLNDKAGFMNSRGQMVIPAMFNEVGSFADGVAAVRMNRKSMYINKTGQIIISNITVDTTPRDLRPEQWSGNKFIILPLDANYQSHGYSFRLQAPNPALQVPGGTNIRADVIRGKQVEVVGVQKTGQEYEVMLREVDSGLLLGTVTEGQQMKHLALAEDLLKARRYFIGKTIYTKNPYYGFVETGKPRKLNAIYFDDPLEVADIWLGVDANQPVWLIADAKTGDRVYIPIAYSQTNTESARMRPGLQWEIVLFEQNPRILYNWSNEVWNKIKGGAISIGMNMEQVQLAWGAPVSMFAEKQGDTTWTIWVYPTTQLYFKQSILAQMKDR